MGEEKIWVHPVVPRDEAMKSNRKKTGRSGRKGLVLAGKAGWRHAGRKRGWDRFWFWAGFCGVLFLLVPCLVLQEEAIFTYHDQLDGELIAYLLQARHLFQGDILPEFMNGASKTALTMPAPGCVLFFLGGDGLGGLMAMMLLGHAVGYLGMYLLVREFTGKAWAGMVAGGLYGSLPFLPVYGLSQFGIPLLFWCVLQLEKGKHRFFAYVYTAVYTLCSSLVLVGFGLLGMGMIWMIGRLAGRRFWGTRLQERKSMGGTRNGLCHVFAAWQLMLGLYLVMNFRLLGQMLGLGEAVISHKAEYVRTAIPFWETFWQGLTQGGQHSVDYHGLLTLVTIGILVAGCLVWLLHGRRECGGAPFPEGVERLARVVLGCMGWNLLFSLAAAFWDSALGVGIRNTLSALGAFQLERLLWISPALWYLAFGSALCLLAELVRWGLCLPADKELEGQKQNRRILRRLVACGLTLAVCGVVGITALRILLAGDVKSNIQKLRNPEYGLMSFGEYYGLGVMEQVEDFLRECTGQEMADYRVVSLGVDPAAALYHGFYCLDGYSNHYSLAYKHQFRRILEPELDKSEYLRDYFDGWGNRCYLFSAECPGYYTIEKGGFAFQSYELDVQALKELGGNYLFAAAPILNAQEQGLVLMREEPFETEGSYYRIFVYGISR